MHEVLIILSAHKEYGLFRAESLVDILNNVRPDVIFLEHSLTEYEESNGLEKKVVELYLVNNKVPVIPCGKPFSEKELLESHQKYQCLSRALETYSSEDYRIKYDNHSHRELHEGFLYLHSHEYGQVQRWLHDEEERIVASANSQEIHQLSRWWSKLQRNRESVILGNIEKQVRENRYKRAVLLIGAEHRNSFLGASKNSGYSEIEWSCYEH